MSKRIFALDDDERMCKLMELHLSKHGYEVKTQSSPMLTDRDVLRFGPDLVILDVQMPWLTGDTMADIFQFGFEITPKIIFFSGLAASELKAMADDKEVDGFVCKSEGMEALLEKVRAVIGS